MLDTTEKNKIKPDTILKNFWRDNRHFADLFNAVFFKGEQVLKLSKKDVRKADSQIRQKEVSNMLSMISYAEEKGEKRGEKRGEKKGEKKGIKKGENRLGMLMKMLLNDKRYADAERASEDEKYRERLYKEFEI